MLKGVFVRLLRCFRSMGFGVQSPNDYRFIRYVINEHYPYYAYDTLKSELDNASKRQHKIGRLLFRIANYKQADTIVTPAGISDVNSTYINHGCWKSELTNDLSKLPCSDIVYVDKLESEIDLFDYTYKDGALIIIDSIDKHDSNARLWKKMLDSELFSVTFDLYRLGILLADKKRYKQHYKINF